MNQGGVKGGEVEPERSMVRMGVGKGAEPFVDVTAWRAVLPRRAHALSQIPPRPFRICVSY